MPAELAKNAPASNPESNSQSISVTPSPVLMPAESKNAPAFDPESNPFSVTPSPSATDEIHENQVEESTSVHAAGLTAATPAPAMSSMVRHGETVAPSAPFMSTRFLATSDIEQMRTVITPTMGMPMYHHGAHQLNDVPFTQLPFQNLPPWGSFAPNLDFERTQGNVTGVDPQYGSAYTNAGNEGWGLLAQLMDRQNLNMGTVNTGTANGYGEIPMGNVYSPAGMTELPPMTMEQQTLDLPRDIGQTSPSNHTSVTSVIEPTSVPALGESLGTRVRKPATSKEVIPLTAMKETEDLPPAASTGQKRKAEGRLGKGKRKRV